MKSAAENKFVTGVPRDQKWVRVEPVSSLPTERVGQIAKDSKLEINPQKDGRLVSQRSTGRDQGIPQKNNSGSNQKTDQQAITALLAEYLFTF